MIETVHLGVWLFANVAVVAKRPSRRHHVSPNHVWHRQRWCGSSSSYSGLSAHVACVIAFVTLRVCWYGWWCDNRLSFSFRQIQSHRNGRFAVQPWELVSSMGGQSWVSACMSSVSHMM